MLQKKICVLGPTAVGKTSLIRQYVQGVFSEKYLTSIGVKIDKKKVESEIPVQLLIWDLEGIDKFCDFDPKYLRGASGVVVVCDNTRFSSLAEAMEIFALAQKTYDIPAILAINKSDLSPSMNWDKGVLDKLCVKFNSVHYTSAKTGDSVEEMFTAIANMVTHL